MTAKEKYIMEKYTRTANIAGWKTLFLDIDQQEFEILASTNVAYFRRQLGIALARMIENEKEEEI